MESANRPALALASPSPSKPAWLAALRRLVTAGAMAAMLAVPLVPARPTFAQDAPAERPPVAAANDEAAARRDANAAYFAEVTRLLETRFYDRQFIRENWPAIREKHAAAVADTGTLTARYTAVNRALGELGKSHLAVVDKYVFETYIQSEMDSRPTLRPGFELARIGGKYFATTIYEGGPAERAGLKRGDEVLAVNGTATGENPDVLDAGSDPGVTTQPQHFVVRLHSADAISLSVRRAPDAAPITVSITPENCHSIGATRASVRIIEAEGKKLGYVHAHHFLNSQITRIVYDALRETFADCDALLFDIRGHGGSPMVIAQLLAPFQKNPTGLARFARMRAPKWEKPVVLLVDENSRSAKEIYAHTFKREELGPLVGRRTTGAVLACTFLELSDGSRLMIPVVDGAQFTQDGTVLEGNGVRPHFVITGTLPYANGRDEIIEAGKAVALTLIPRDGDSDEGATEDGADETGE